MRVIRPGKIASSIQGPETERKVRSAPEKPSRDIWDDFSGAKKTTKKKEYEPGPGNRMVQRASQNGDGDDSLEGRAAREGSEGIDGSRTYQPRTDFEVLEAKLNYTFKDRSLLARRGHPLRSLRCLRCGSRGTRAAWAWCCTATGSTAPG